jgi:hypothetical protein
LEINFAKDGLGCCHIKIYENISEVALLGAMMNGFDGTVTEYDQVQCILPPVIPCHDPHQRYDLCPRVCG